MLALSLLLLSCVISGCGEKSVEKLAVGTSIQTGDWNVTLNSFNIIHAKRYLSFINYMKNLI